MVLFPPEALKAKVGRASFSIWSRRLAMLVDPAGAAPPAAGEDPLDPLPPVLSAGTEPSNTQKSPRPPVSGAPVHPLGTFAPRGPSTSGTSAISLPMVVRLHEVGLPFTGAPQLGSSVAGSSSPLGTVVTTGLHPAAPPASSSTHFWFSRQPPLKPLFSIVPVSPQSGGQKLLESTHS